MPQVLLKWLLKQGISAIPKSATSTRIIHNTHLFDFDIPEEDMKRLSSLDFQVFASKFVAFSHHFKDQSKLFDNLLKPYIDSLLNSFHMQFLGFVLI